MSDANIGGLNPDMSLLAASQAQRLTAPFPTIQVNDYKYYYNTLANTCMHRQDGSKIAFINHVCKTNLKYDIIFLEHEIEQGHPTLRVASEQEIYQYKMTMDPKGTIREEMKSDPELRAELEAQIRAEILASMNGSIDQAKVEGIDSPLSKLKQGIRSGTGTLLTPQSSADIKDAAAGS